MEKLYQKINSLKIQTICAIFFVLGFVVYGNTLANPFLWDDQLLIVNNSFIQDWKYLPQYFSRPLFAGAGAAGDYWRPLQTLSFALDYHLGGLNPLVYHIVNVLWHIGAAILAYATLEKIFNHKPAAFLSATIFLVHPLQTEAVTYISGRADLLLAVFLFLSFLFFWKYVSGREKKKLFFSLSLLFFALSFLAKERTIVFPAIIFLYLFTLFEEKIFENWKRKVWWTLPYVVIALGYLALRKFILPIETENLSTSISSSGFFEIGKTFLKFVGVFIQLFILPVKLVMQRPVEKAGFFDFQVIAGLFFVVFSLVGFVLSLRKNRVWAFGLGWFWIFFIFSFFSFLRMGFLMEHWLYFPMLGILAPLFISLLEKIHAVKNIFWENTFYVLIFLFIFFLSFRTFIRNCDWQNPIVFYEKNIAQGAHSAEIYNNLGAEYLIHGKNREAASLFIQAIAIDNHLPLSYFNLGTVYENTGEWSLAEKYYLEALKRQPSGIPIYERLQAVYAAQGKNWEAIRITEEALKINPNDALMLANLGLLYKSQGDIEKAVTNLKKALELEPENEEYRKALEEIIPSKK